jgi:hypothetical protein
MSANEKRHVGLSLRAERFLTKTGFFWLSMHGALSDDHRRLYRGGAPLR